MAGTRFRFGVGAVPRGRTGRKRYMGPLEPGPWAFAFGLATVIAADPMHGTYGDVIRGKAENREHEVAEGDTVIFDDVEYRVRFSDGFNGRHGRLEFIQLDFVRDRRVCERCGSDKPAGQSCGCFDNNCQ